MSYFLGVIAFANKKSVDGGVHFFLQVRRHTAFNIHGFNLIFVALGVWKLVEIVA